MSTAPRRTPAAKKRKPRTTKPEKKKKTRKPRSTPPVPRAKGAHAPVPFPDQAPGTDIVWGAIGIGRVCNRPPGWVFHQLRKRALPARKIAGRWCSSIEALTKHLAVAADDEAAS